MSIYSLSILYVCLSELRYLWMLSSLLYFLVIEYSCLGDWFVGKDHFFAVANTKESRYRYEALEGGMCDVIALEGGMCDVIALKGGMCDVIKIRSKIRDTTRIEKGNQPLNI